jgi:hypothetical protein
MTDSNIEYYPDPLAAYADGCVMDLRFRTALQFVNSMLSSGRALEATPGSIASHALDVVDNLFDQGKTLGWIAGLPASSELNSDTKRHLERHVKAQLYQQKVAQQEQAGAVRTVLNG